MKLESSWEDAVHGVGGLTEESGKKVATCNCYIAVSLKISNTQKSAYSNYCLQKLEVTSMSFNRCIHNQL